MKTLLTLFITALLAVGADARLGETLEQCRERYGRETKTNGEKLTFVKNGFEIQIHFFDGRAETLSYQKTETSGIFNSAVSISQNEIETLLKSNVASEWNAYKESLTYDWATAAGDRAGYSKLDNRLDIESAGFVQRLKARAAKAAAAKKADEDKQLKGL